MVHRVDVYPDLFQALRLGIVREQACIGEVEVGIEIEQYLLPCKGFAAIGHAGRANILPAHVLKPLAAMQRQ